MKNGFKTQLKARLEKSFTDVNDLETISLENRNHVSAMKIGRASCRERV